MERSIEACTGETFDLLVVGGGIHGAGVARDAALRGLRVVLLERGDFGEGTSSRSSGLIHGGLRYLALGQIGVVRECLRERALLLRLAPHLVRPLPFLLPFYRGGRAVGLGHSRTAVRLGLALYDRLGGRGALPPHRLLGRAETLAADPQLRADGLRGAVRYQDAAVDDRRLVIVNLVSAAREGAVLVNHAQVVDVEPGFIIHARDALTREGFCVRAHAVVNAAGPLADEVVRRIGLTDLPRLRLSKGAHIVLPGRPGVTAALLLHAPRDGRVFFVLPRDETTVIGTTETAFAGDPLRVTADQDDISYLLAAASAHLPDAGFGRSRVFYTFAGLRPLVARGKAALGRLSREAVIHVSRIRSRPFISVLGGKLTAYRAQAQRVVDHLTRTPSRTDREPLPGAFEGEPGSFERAEVSEAGRRFGIESDLARHLVRRYGREWTVVAGLLTDRPELGERLVAGRPEIRAEVLHAVRHEMAVALTDVVLGRLTLGRAPDQGSSCAERVADLMAQELGWDPRRRAEEIDRFEERLEERRPPA